MLKFLDKVGEITAMNADILKENFRLKRKCNRLKFKLAVQRKVAESCARDASNLRAECDNLKKQLNELCVHTTVSNSQDS